MALQILKLPISRCCSNTFFFSSKSSPNLSARWLEFKMRNHLSVRTFASMTTDKGQPKKNLGKVLVDGKVVTKAGTQIPDKAVVEIMAEIPKYVCRGGHKLEAAIENLGIDVTGKVALDSGLSTGGFTDCLLQYGASFVYGVDVGYGQVADKIRRDERVSVIERTNLRYLSELPQKVDLVTLDLSFISILLVMPAVVNLMKQEATLVTLIKPQFEARRSQVGGGGIVRDPLVHQEVIEKIINGVQNHGFQCKGWIESPLKGAEGNIEFLACFNRAVISEEVEKQ
ncbi:uncharacterized protein LOC132056749 isoform X3 [Lycium ferocissimum]|uniref:uncharacterized protein LOC132056749 isoform X3 n=1 Tax=Lycium ferocissimum TaxID=112874 RepID=UPI002815F739|nr:uncharacterized protein LOC132056749 isoform X3 [Lycium ferocissimum]